MLRTQCSRTVLSALLRRATRPTETQELLSGSPALDAGDPNFVSPPDFDQRGDGFPRVIGNRIDIGAFEGVVNRAPMITSNGGGDTAAVSVSEGSTVVTNIDASDPDDETENGGGLTYSLTGLDNALFSINVDSGELTFSTAPDFEDPQSNGGNNIYDVTVTVTDEGGLTDSQAIAVTVTNVNEAPDGADNTLTVLQDGTLTFATADFGFTDLNDTPANALLAVTITSLPDKGSMTLSGNAVSAGQSVSAADITSGLLQYDPVVNENGTDYSSFTFQVQDDGGTDNGGVDLDAIANTITIDVTSVNDAPSADAGGPATLVLVPGGTVQLDASATYDVELPNSELTYQWDFDGDNVFDDATGIAPVFSAANIENPRIDDNRLARHRRRWSDECGDQDRRDRAVGDVTRPEST